MTITGSIVLCRNFERCGNAIGFARGTTITKWLCPKCKKAQRVKPSDNGELWNKLSEFIEEKEK